MPCFDAANLVHATILGSSVTSQYCGSRLGCRYRPVVWERAVPVSASGRSPHRSPQHPPGVQAGGTVGAGDDALGAAEAVLLGEPASFCLVLVDDCFGHDRVHRGFLELGSATSVCCGQL